MNHEPAKDLLNRHSIVPLAHPPRLFTIDVDGTLLDRRHQVSDVSIDAIAHVRARGVEVLLATSRGPQALKPILEVLSLLHPAVFVCSQGAITGSYIGDKLNVLSRCPLPVQLARRVVRQALVAGITVNWFSESAWLVNRVDATVETESRIVGSRPRVCNLLAQARGPDKLMLIVPEGRRDELQLIAEALPSELTVQASNPGYLEITRADVDKGRAVEAYCQAMDIPARGVVAIGDGPNDLSLFDFAGLSIAPANAHESVRNAATLNAPSNDDDGVAHTLYALVP